MPSTVHNLRAAFHQLRGHQSNLRLSMTPFSADDVMAHAYLAEEAAAALGIMLDRILDMERECCDPDSKTRRSEVED